MKRSILVKSILSCAVLAGTLRSNIEPSFDPLDLPKGARVTIPQPATTLMPLDMTIKLGATDRAQAISLQSVGQQRQVIMVKIHDPQQKTDKTLELRPGRRVFYNYSGLHTISVEVESDNPNLASNSKIRIESNRPLEISY